jgi:hypothetical protein
MTPVATRRLAIVVSEEEVAMFRAVAEDEGLTVSAWVRRAALLSYRRLLKSKSRAAVKRRLRT